MQAIVFCKTEAKGKQTFYLKANGERYYLFTQAYRRSNKEFFQNGVCVSEINNYSGVHSTAVRNTLDKLPTYIRYVEKEYEIAVYEKTKMSQQTKKRNAYKRQPFLWRQLDWKIA